MKCSELAQEAIDKVRQQRTADSRRRPARVVKKCSDAGGKTAGFMKAVLAAAGIFVFSSFIFVSCAKFLSSFEKQKQSASSSARAPVVQRQAVKSASVKRKHNNQRIKWVDKNGTVHLSGMKSPVKKHYGQKIYKLVDRNGVVHLSNTKGEECE
jgi:hypothetical protein